MSPPTAGRIIFQERHAIKPIRYLPLMALFALGTALAAGAPDSQHKQKIDEDQAVELVAKAMLAAPGLEFDTSFNGTGMKSVEPLSGSGWSNIEGGIRAFPWTGSVMIGSPPVLFPVDLGYYVVTRQKNDAQSLERVMVTRLNPDGTMDTSFGTNGWMQADYSSTSIADVALGQYDELYILHAGEKRVGCYRLESTGSANFCHNPVTGGKLSYPLTGTRTAATPTRLLYDKRYGLFVAAKITNSDRGTELAITLMEPAGATGTSGGHPVSSFGSSGHVIGLPSWAPATGVTAAINAMTLTPASATGGQRLYVGGQVSRSGPDSDGFLLGLNPTTGATIGGWNWLTIYYEGDNAGNKADAVTALTVLRNGTGHGGKLVYAGWSETDSAQTQPMIMGRFANDGVWDTSFCAGNANYSVRACVVDPPWSGGAPIYASYKPSSIPVAIVERPNRDLAVAQRFQQNGGSLISSPDPHVHTLVQQFSPDGTRLYSTLSVDYPGSSTNSVDWWSRPFDMVKAGVVSDGLLLIGTRNWSSTDFDPTVTVLKGGTDAHVCLFKDGMENTSPACW